MKWFFRKLKHLFVLFVVAIYLLFEELIWDKIAEPIHNLVKSFKFYDAFLSYIQTSANRYLVLILFILPFIVGELLGIASAMLVANAQVALAILIYCLKIPIVIIAFAILRAGDSKLESFTWFSKSRKAVMLVIENIKSSAVYQRVKEIKEHLKSRIKIGRSSFMELIHKTYAKRKVRNDETGN
jgi:hypothetical protein